VRSLIGRVELALTTSMKARFLSPPALAAVLGAVPILKLGRRLAVRRRAPGVDSAAASA
jgi:hypothetical protein